LHDAGDEYALTDNLERGHQAYSTYAITSK